jgi:hypothetical protein
MVETVDLRKNKTCLECGDHLCKCNKCHNAACDRFMPHPGDGWMLSRTYHKKTSNPSVLLRAYRLYSLIVMTAAYTIMTQVWLQSAQNGLSNGIFQVVIRTDVIGENWPELAILLSAVPGAAWIFYRVFLNIYRGKK